MPLSNSPAIRHLPWPMNVAGFEQPFGAKPRLAVHREIACSSRCGCRSARRAGYFVCLIQRATAEHYCVNTTASSYGGVADGISASASHSLRSIDRAAIAWITKSVRRFIRMPMTAWSPSISVARAQPPGLHHLGVRGAMEQLWDSSDPFL